MKREQASPGRWCLPTKAVALCKLRLLLRFGCVIVCCLFIGRLAQAAPRIVFDFSYDTAGFFTPERREVLSMAADSVNRWVDTLSPIVESNGNTWMAQFFRPDTGIGVMIPAGSGFGVPANDIRVYVGARDLGPPYLAVAQPSGAIGLGTQEWKNTVQYRGQTPGPPHVDYGPWSGSIAFNTNPAISWYSQASPAGILNNQYDLFTVAAHELLHVFGFGAASSYFALTNSGQFAGTKAIAAGSASNPSLNVSNDGGHWAEGTTGALAGNQVLSILTPTIFPGQRLRPTDLDLAALDDFGWESALPGDTNRDRVVDFSDAFMLGSHYGLQDTAGWSKADFNGDGHVTFSDAFQLVSNYGFSYATSPALVGSENLQVVYNAATGELKLEDDQLGLIKSLQVTSNSGLLAVGQASWLGQDTSYFVDLASEQGFATLTAFGNSMLATAGSSLGALLPPGLSPEQLQADLQILYGIEGRAGIFAGTLTYLAVPEPSGAALMFVALAAIARMRGKVYCCVKGLRL